MEKWRGQRCSDNGGEQHYYFFFKLTGFKVSGTGLYKGHPAWGQGQVIEK